MLNKNIKYLFTLAKDKFNYLSEKNDKTYYTTDV